MDIKTLGDLGKLADLCRKKGIESIKIIDGTVEFKLSPIAPNRRKRSTVKLSTPDPVTGKSERTLTDEDVLLWSSPVMNEFASAGGES